jgi:hypothetical protein
LNGKIGDCDMRKVIPATVLVCAALAVLGTAQENTLSDARVGEWALYQTSGGNVQERHSVIARRRQVVVVRVDSIINGKVISSRTENFRLDTPSFLRGAEGREDVTAGGRTYNCLVVVRGDRKLYYTNQVPVTGLVLITKEGVMLQEVIDFGY